jgi:hypothetical protein
MIDLIMAGLVAPGALAIAGLSLRARTAEHWSLFDVALAFAALSVSGRGRARGARIPAAERGAVIPLVPTIPIPALGSLAAVAVALRSVARLASRDPPHHQLQPQLAFAPAIVFLAVSMLGVNGLEAAGVEIGVAQSSRFSASSGQRGMVVAIVYGVRPRRSSRRSCSAASRAPPVRVLGPAPAIVIDASPSVSTSTILWRSCRSRSATPPGPLAHGLALAVVRAPLHEQPDRLVILLVAP